MGYINLKQRIAMVKNEETVLLSYILPFPPSTNCYKTTTKIKKLTPCPPILYPKCSRQKQFKDLRFNLHLKLPKICV